MLRWRKFCLSNNADVQVCLSSYNDAQLCLSSYNDAQLCLSRHVSLTYFCADRVIQYGSSVYRHVIRKQRLHRLCILGRVRKTLKSGYSLRHVGLSLHPHQTLRLPHWTYFQEVCSFIVFRKSAKKIQVSLISHKNNGYFNMWK